MRDRCLGDACELTQSLQSVLKCLKLTLWLSRDEHLRLAKGFTTFSVEIRDSSAFVARSPSLPVQWHEGAAAALRVPVRAAPTPVLGGTDAAVPAQLRQGRPPEPAQTPAQMGPCCFCGFVFADGLGGQHRHSL